MLWFLLLGLWTGCGGQAAPTEPDAPDDTGTTPPNTSAESPAGVTDLSVASTTDSSATITFTEVDDGTGSPAKYDVRLDSPSIDWGSAPSVTGGSCATPLEGSEVGATLTCTVQGLTTETTYEFQLVAYRGTLGEDAVFGELSNVAPGATDGAGTGGTGGDTTSTTSSGTGASLVEDFSSYSDIDHFLTDPNGWYLGRKNTGQMSFDPTVTVDSAEKSLRYDFPENNSCSNYTITNELDVAPSATELWVEVWARFSSNWHTTLLGCESLAYDYKFLLGWTESSRFQIKMGKAGDHIVVSGPGGATSELFLELLDPLATEFFDGQWHRYRMHWRVNGDGTGTLRQWIDGTLIAEETGAISADAVSITRLMLGANRNHGMDEPMTLWFGPVRLWRENPGW